MGDEATWDRIAKVLLSVSTLFFSFAMTIFIVFEPAQLGQVMYPLLLVVLPAIALIGALRGSSWWRGAGMLAFLCTWAYLLKSAWRFGTWDHYQQAMLDGSLYFGTFTAIVSACLIGLPLMIFHLNRCRDDPDDDVDTEPSIFELSAALDSVTAEIFREGSMQGIGREKSPR